MHVTANSDSSPFDAYESETKLYANCKVMQGDASCIAAHPPGVANADAKKFASLWTHGCGSPRARTNADCESAETGDVPHSTSLGTEQVYKRIHGNACILYCTICN